MHRSPFIQTFQVYRICYLPIGCLNSKRFVGMMKDVRVEAEEALVSFDVTSLFTNVPIDEAVDVIHRKLKEDLAKRTPLDRKSVV